MSYPEFFEKYGKEADEGEYYQVTVSYDGKSKSYVSKKDTCVCWLSTTDMFGNTSTYCGTEDYDKRQYYYYKLIDTRVKHTAPTLQQIKKLSDVTYERPIDDPKYITFLGV
jgi:S-adenosylmethionine hydrolase